MLIRREQYYLNLLQPDYNICKIAGSPLGVKRSEKTKNKISISISGINHPIYGKHHTDETRKKVSETLKSLTRIYIKHEILPETRLKLSLRSIGLIIKIYDSEHNFITEFPSIKSTAKYIGVSDTTIKRVLYKDIPYKNYTFKSEIKDNKI